MSEITNIRISEAQVESHASTNVVEIPDAIKGFHTELFPGDIVTFGDLFLTTLGKSVFDEDNNFAKGCFWVSEAQIKRGDIVLKGQDIPSSVFFRCAQARNVPALGATQKTDSGESPILYGEELFMEFLKSLKLSKAAQDFNLSVARACSARTKLRELKGKTLKVVAAKTAFTLRFNSKKREDWGSRPGDWKSTRVLFFEKVK